MIQLQPIDQNSVIFAKTSERAIARSISGEYLTFLLGREEYAIDILAVQEIRGYEQPTSIVGTTTFIKGVINLRGAVVPIVDLRSKFDLPDVTYNNSTVVIIVNIEERVVGLVVDVVSDVIELAPETIFDAPSFNTSFDADFITGIAKKSAIDGGQILILVDISRLVQGL